MQALAVFRGRRQALLGALFAQVVCSSATG